MNVEFKTHNSVINTICMSSQFPTINTPYMATQLAHLYTKSSEFYNTEFPKQQKSKNYYHNYKHVGTAVAQWLRRCATNLKVAGSIPDGVIGIFH